MVQIAICDDEGIWRTRLKDILIPWLELNDIAHHISQFSCGEELSSAYAKARFDLIFLDIEMPGMSGMETAKAIRRIDYHSKIIFLTAYPDYVFQSYEVQAFHYILKPYNGEKLLSVTKRAIKELNKEARDFYLIPNGSGNVRINLRDVLYFYSDKRMIVAVPSKRAPVESIPQEPIASPRENLCFYGKLDDVQKGLPDYYCRIHQRYLVNLNQVVATEENAVWVGSETLPVSRTHKQNFLIAYAKTMLKEG